MIIYWYLYIAVRNTFLLDNTLLIIYSLGMLSNKGFTLIELLVVIAIIGALSSLIVPNFMTARERARDVQRKSDLKQLQNALELYREDQSPPAYPADSAIFPATGSVWIDSTGKITYINRFPGDPLKKSYYYARDPAGGGVDTLKYTLCACLENSADSDSLSGNCSADLSYVCTSGRKYEVNEP